MGPSFLKSPLDDSNCHIQIDSPDLTHDIDVSLLLNYPHLKFDLDITHTLSGTTWNLPSQALTPQGFLAATLATLVKDSPFPKSSIDALLGYLCLQSALSLTCIDFSHIIHIFSQLKIPAARPLNDLKLALDDMPYEVALEGIIDVWEDQDTSWNLEDPIIHLLVAKIRTKPTDKTFIKRMFPRLTEHLFSLCLFISGYGTLNTCIEMVRWRWRPMDPEGHSSQTAANPQDILKNPSTFLFVFETESNGVGAISDSLFLLLPQWLWIRHMFSSGCSESKTRVAHLPHWMTRTVLLPILYSLRGRELSPKLPSEVAMVILEHASELNLCTHDDRLLAPFKQLLVSVRKICFPPVTNSNCFDLLKLYHQHNRERDTREILGFIARSLPSIGASALVKLSPELYTLLYEHLHHDTVEDSVLETTASPSFETPPHCLTVPPSEDTDGNHG